MAKESDKSSTIRIRLCCAHLIASYGVNPPDIINCQACGATWNSKQDLEALNDGGYFELKEVK